MKKNNLVNAIIKIQSIGELKKVIYKYHPYDVAKIFPLLNEEERLKIYNVYDDEKLAEIFSYLDDANDYFLELEVSKSASIIENMERDDATDTLSELDSNLSSEIYSLLAKETKEELSDLEKYEEGTAGAIMNNNFISLNLGIDVKEAMKKIVSVAPDVEDINTSFVIDEEGKLVGTLDLKKLIVTKSPFSIDNIMDSNFKWVDVRDDVEEAIKIVSDYDIYNLAVLENGVLKGTITMDDVADALVDEAEDDYAKFSGLTEEENQSESFFSSVKKRIPWLVILLLLDIIVSIIISQFDYIFEVDSLTILVAFQPVILGLSGNCGTQSLAIAVREISNDELDKNKQIFNFLGRELTFGFLTGIILGILGFALVFLMLLIRDPMNTLHLKLSLVVGVAILASLIIANLLGALIPIIFYKIKIDPAVASGPFITTINDITAIITYFTLATILIYNFL